MGEKSKSKFIVEIYKFGTINKYKNRFLKTKLLLNEVFWAISQGVFKILMVPTGLCGEEL